MTRSPHSTAASLIPPRPTLPTLRGAAQECHACPLWQRGTQTVFGEGAPNAEVMLVGEQPGDEEDRQGRPFVGPAGRLLDRLLGEAGIDRRQLYVTNTVKHFKWVERGRRRLHEKPNAAEITACAPWLAAEIAVVGPRVLVCLGATAAQALLGRDFRVRRQRGQFLPSPLAEYVMATVHPSAVLRSPDEETREREEALLLEDLLRVAAVVRTLRAEAQSVREMEPRE
jgi:uracil-DNA glycosylase family protein